MPHSDQSQTVYSTDSPRQAGKKRNKPTQPVPNDGVIRVGRKTKGVKGKGLTVIQGLNLETEALKKLAKSLKQKCGTGGSIKEGVIEIQGDHRDFLVEELMKQGYVTKRSGG